MSNCSASWASVRSPAMAARATFALKAGVWFRRGRRCMVSPDLQVTACPPSSRNSTYRLVQISGASSWVEQPGIAGFGGEQDKLTDADDAPVVSGCPTLNVAHLIGEMETLAVDQALARSTLD